MEIDSLKSEISALRQFEDTIKSAAIDARKNADQTMASAKKEAEQIMSKARGEAEQLIKMQSKKIAALEAQLSKLELSKKTYISKLRSMINSHLEIVEEAAKADIKKDLTGIADDDESIEDFEVTDSSEVSRSTLETIATEPSEESIKTEDANAAEEILPAAAAAILGNNLDSAPPPTEDNEKAQIEEPVNDKASIDPELSVALESYKAKAEAEGSMDPGNQNPIDELPVPPQGAIVETTKTAEEVPDEFITANEPMPESDEDNDDPIKVNTDRVNISPDAQDTPTEHNQIDIDKVEDKKESSSGDIGDELDKIVDAFEQKMDEAAKR